MLCSITPGQTSSTATGYAGRRGSNEGRARVLALGGRPQHRLAPTRVILGRLLGRRRLVTPGLLRLRAARRRVMMGCGTLTRAILELHHLRVAQVRLPRLGIQDLPRRLAALPAATMECGIRRSTAVQHRQETLGLHRLLAALREVTTGNGIPTLVLQVEAMRNRTLTPSILTHPQRVATVTPESRLGTYPTATRAHPPRPTKHPRPRSKRSSLRTSRASVRTRTHLAFPPTKDKTFPVARTTSFPRKSTCNASAPASFSNTALTRVPIPSSGRSRSTLASRQMTRSQLAPQTHLITTSSTTKLMIQTLNHAIQVVPKITPRRLHSRSKTRPAMRLTKPTLAIMTTVTSFPTSSRISLALSKMKSTPTTTRAMTLTFFTTVRKSRRKRRRSMAPLRSRSRSRSRRRRSTAPLRAVSTVYGSCFFRGDY